MYRNVLVLLFASVLLLGGCAVGQQTVPKEKNGQEANMDGLAFDRSDEEITYMDNMIKARIRPYFAPLGLQLREVTPQHIEDFYQSILADDCTTNTVIHYHAIIRKALQTAVKKDILLKNPADKVDRPKKNVFHGSFYSEEEMLTLFDAVSGDPLELCVKIAAYPEEHPPHWGAGCPPAAGGHRRDL